jgi:flagellar biosynthesis component FlhA
MEAQMFNWKTRECVQEVLALIFAALFLMFALATPAKAFLPIGIAVGGAMVGGAMQAERQQSQHSEQYQRNENGAETRHAKKTTKARNRKRERDDIKVAKSKSPEPVASAPQAKPLTVDRPTTPDKFGE